jgi:hypothetical protein
VYYAEGYNEDTIRAAMETYLQIPANTLEAGKAPNFNSELKLIWDRRNTTHKLTLTKEQTTNRDQLALFKKKQHCLYELRLLLKEDVNFLENGRQGDVVADEKNEVKFWNCRYVKDDKEVGHSVCYSFRGSTDPDMISRIYRFRNLASAYKYVRNKLIRFELTDDPFNRNFTNLEMCDSFIAGFGSAELSVVKEGDYATIAEKSPPKQHDLKDFIIRS